MSSYQLRSIGRLAPFERYDQSPLASLTYALVDWYKIPAEFVHETSAAHFTSTGYASSLTNSFGVFEGESEWSEYC